MKYSLFIFLLTTISFNSIAQDTTFTLSKYELFNSKPGTIYKTEIKNIGSIGTCYVWKVRTVEMGTGNEMSAIKIGEDDNLQVVTPHAIYIEMEDLDSVIHVLDYFANTPTKPKPKNNMFYTYVTSNDVQIALSYYSAGIFSGFNLSIARLFKNSRIIMRSSSCNISRGRLPDFIDLLKKAKVAEF